jgi:glucan phosphorylase
MAVQKEPIKVSIDIFADHVNDGTRIIIPFTIGGRMLPIAVDGRDLLVTLKAHNAEAVEITVYDTMVSVHDIVFPNFNGEKKEKEISQKIFEETYVEFSEAARVAQELANTNNEIYSVIRVYSENKHRVVDGKFNLGRNYYHGAGGQKMFFDHVLKCEPKKQ